MKIIWSIFFFSFFALACQQPRLGITMIYKITQSDGNHCFAALLNHNSLISYQNIDAKNLHYFPPTLVLRNDIIFEFLKELDKEAKQTSH